MVKIAKILIFDLSDGLGKWIIEILTVFRGFR